MNIFRHWFMWSAIEVAPGKYDWSDYDRIMDLAAKNGIKVVVEELVGCAPEWAFRKYPHARYLGSDDFVVNSTVSESSATGGFPGLCLDNPEVQALAQTFLVALVERYRNHPALFGYDLWNEGTSFGGNPHRDVIATVKAQNENCASGCAFATDHWRDLHGNGTAIVTSPGTT